MASACRLTWSCRLAAVELRAPILNMCKPCEKSDSDREVDLVPTALHCGMYGTLEDEALGLGLVVVGQFFMNWWEVVLAANVCQTQ
eukprot:scaffold26052_cov108-Cylindrotheca_fusiformis.AAC.1